MSEEIKSLENIIDGEEPVTEVAEKEPAGQEDEPTGVEDVEAKAESETIEDSPPESDDKTEETLEELKANISALHAKNQDEKRKRQELERKVEATQNEVELPDAFAEPDKAIAYSEATILKRIEDVEYRYSEKLAKFMHEDYDAMADLFFDKLQHENPALADQARQSGDICEFAYKTAKNYTDMAEINEAGGVTQLLEKREKELFEKWTAEKEAKDKEKAEKILTDSIPGSLANKRAAGSNKAETWSGDQPLEDIVG